MGVSAVRHRDATPPEDEEGVATPPGDPLATPIYSRDVWAFGNLMLQTIEEISTEGVLGLYNDICIIDCCYRNHLR